MKPPQGMRWLHGEASWDAGPVNREPTVRPRSQLKSSAFAWGGCQQRDLAAGPARAFGHGGVYGVSQRSRHSRRGAIAAL